MGHLGSVSPTPTIGNKMPKVPRKRGSGLSRKQKDQIYRDLGMTKVRGARSGKIYYE